MKTITIRRMFTPWATLGEVTLSDGSQSIDMWSLELPWRGNKRSISCIPNGGYICKKYNSPKYKDTYEVQDVPNRSYILFHKGNTTRDTEGCILLGKASDIIDNKIKVLDSKTAFDTFMDFMGDDEEIELIILPYLIEYA
jgi:hypothetical protein